MGIINSNKSIGDTTLIDCQGFLDVTIGITAAPDIVSRPTDIVLVLDRSTSMQGQPLADMKTGVNTFIDIIASATGGAPDEIGSGSHIGIVSFASTAVQDAALITSVSDLKTAAAALTAGGSTNHSAAFSEATALLSASSNSKVIVMFTDGVTTAGPNASTFAAAARAQGIIVYCIGLLGSGGLDVNALNDWATDPDVTHVAIAPNSSQLQQIFADLAANIAVPGATNIVINEAVNPDFNITGSPVATVGTISQLTASSFQWTIDQLGATLSESATVSFAIQHIGATGGTKPIDESLSYADDEGNTVSFANPSVFVNCEPEDARLDVVKSADKTSASGPNEDITYTLVVSNTGNVPLKKVIVYDSIPQGLCYKPGTTKKDDCLPVDVNPKSGVFIGRLAPGESSTVTFVLNICGNPYCSVPVTTFVNTAWAEGLANQTEVNTVSNQWVVSLDKFCITKKVVECFPICDFACYRNAYLYYTDTDYYASPAGGIVKAGYGVSIKYTDCRGKQKSRSFEGSVIFAGLPDNFDFSNSKVRFVDLMCRDDCNGNLRAEFKAILCYCDRT